jgi:hypothetical protein
MEHLIPSQCPGSVEFLRRYGVVDEAGEDSSAWKHRGDVHGVHGSTVLVCSGGGKVVALRRGRIQAILQGLANAGWPWGCLSFNFVRGLMRMIAIPFLQFFGV